MKRNCHEPLGPLVKTVASGVNCHGVENMEKYVNPVVFSVLSTDLSLEGV